MNDTDSLMKSINYKFKNISNLNEALTHSSFVKVALKSKIMKG